MSDFEFNIAKGRTIEFYNRVQTNDPSTSALIVVVLQSTGLEADAVLIDKTTLADVLSGTTNEATNSGYVRVTLTDVDLTPAAPDNTTDTFTIGIADQVWTSVQVTGGAWGKMLVCYDGNTGSGTDANIIPLTAQDFAVTPNGANITAVINASGLFRAS